MVQDRPPPAYDLLTSDTDATGNGEARLHNVIRRHRGVIAVLSTVILWSLTTWYATDWILHVRMTNELRHFKDGADLDAMTLAGNLDRHLEALSTIPEVLALLPSIGRALTDIGRAGPEAQAVLSRTEKLRRQFARLMRHGVPQDVFLLDAAGRCVVAAGGTPDVDRLCSERKIVPLRLAEGGADAIVSGVWPRTAGLFHITPIYRGGRRTGAIVARIDSAVAKRIPDNDAFVADENGVVILARDGTLLMRTVPGAAVMRLAPDERLKRYGRRTFLPLPLRADPDHRGFVRWRSDPTPAIVATKTSYTGTFTINVVRRFEALEKQHNDHLVLFALLSGIGTMGILLIMAGVVSLQRSRRHGREIDRLNTILVSLASTDDLTGVANRRQLLSILEAERQRSLRSGAPFSLLQIDFDRFKQINDRFGHAVGDRALCHVVSQLQRISRGGDWLGRTGGDEFVAMLPDTDAEQAFAVARRMCDLVAASPLYIETQRLALSLSIGVAQWHPERPESIAVLLSRADQALYRAKQAGRNRVEPEIPLETATDEPMR